MSRNLHIDGAGRLTDRTFLNDDRVGAALDLLNRDGEAARVVGGAVRNALLGLSPGDIDIATTASPQWVMAVAKQARIRAVPTGIEHGTVTLVVRGLPLEVTTLREDVETDGRHAVVRFGRDFAEDARRRDFTVNALSVDAEGVVHDVTGGVADLAAGRVRFIGDPATRIREDYLRILRFFRFSASYATDALDPEGLAACVSEAAGLSRISRERVRVELCKLLEAPRAALVISAMAAAGLLQPIVGSPCRPHRFARLAAVEAAGGWQPEAMRGLAALAMTEAASTATLRDQLRLSNAERDRLAATAVALGRLASEHGPPATPTLLALAHESGPEAARDAVLLRFADTSVPPDDVAWQTTARQAAVTPTPVLPISGAALLERGMAPGPQMGAVLKDVQQRWIRAGFPTDPVTLQRLLDDAVAAAPPPR